MIATNSPGRWLFLVRATWVVITLLILVINIVAIPYYDAVLKTVCTASANCFRDQLTLSDVQGLHALRISISAYAILNIVENTLFFLICVALGALLFWHRSHESMALFCSFMLVMFGAALSTISSEGLAPLSPGWYALIEFLYLLGQVSLFLFFYLFPTGRFVPRWTRWSALLYAGYTVWTIISFHPGQFTTGLEALLLFGLFLTTPVAQVYRYRRVSTLSQRQQTKWVVFAFSITIVGFIILLFAAHFLFPPGGSTSIFGKLINSTITINIFLLIPCSIAIAIRNSRLWDIDTIINKALVYGSLTVLLAAVYAALIIGLESLVELITRQTAPPLVIVISTLAIAALFQPLRRRIQRGIDRRFYRRKYDATKIVEAFSVSLRNEVDLSQLSEHLLTVVQETMQPAHVSLWLPKPAPPLPYKAKAWVTNDLVPPYEE